MNNFMASNAYHWLDFEDLEVWENTSGLHSYHMQFCLFGGD